MGLGLELGLGLGLGLGATPATLALTICRRTSGEAVPLCLPSASARSGEALPLRLPAAGFASSTLGALGGSALRVSDLIGAASPSLSSSRIDDSACGEGGRLSLGARCTARPSAGRYSGERVARGEEVPPPPRCGALHALARCARGVLHRLECGVLHPLTLAGCGEES